MKRLALMFGLLVCLTTPSFAISEFSKQFRTLILESDTASDDFKKTVRRAGCNACHVKGEKKEEARNEYGQAVNKFLSAEDFPKEYLKANPEEAKAKILAGFEEANKLKSKDGREFGKKIEAEELPATDSGL